MLTSQELYSVHMKRKIRGQVDQATKDVLVEARNTTHALQVAKEVHRGYRVDHVTPSGTIYWKLR